MGVVLGLVLDPVGGSAAQHAAEQELRKVQYHRDDPSVLARALHWLAERLQWLFSGSPGGHTALVVLILLLAGIIFAVVRAGVPARSLRRIRSEDDDPLRSRGARDHRRLAGELAAAGRRAEAMREWLRAAVQTIEDRGVLAPQPGRTGAATAREAGPVLPAAADALREAMAAFDEVWFGGRPAAAADVAAARTAADAVLAARIESGFAPVGQYALPW